MIMARIYEATGETDEANGLAIALLIYCIVLRIPYPPRRSLPLAQTPISPQNGVRPQPHPLSNTKPLKPTKKRCRTQAHKQAARFTRRNWAGSRPVHCLPWGGSLRPGVAPYVNLHE